MPLISFASSRSTCLNAAAFSLATFSISFLNPSFSSMSFFIASARSGALLNRAFALRRVFSIMSTMFSAASPVLASILLIPAAIALSETILKNPMLPVAEVWHPPQSSTESPKRTMRTWSPYFSPNSAIAPIALASSIVPSLFSTRGKFVRINSLTLFSTLSICSSVSFSK